jgi:cytochrome c-type biogenesis protein CcmH
MTILVLLLLALPALSVEPDEMLPDPAQEARAREIGRELRCLVCQNQSIDDSNAPLARDLRVLVRQRIAAGDSDDAVIDYVVARYGDFVRLKPPFDARTWALWLGAPLLLIAGVAAIVVQRRRRPATPQPLTEAERQRLDELLK